MINFIDVTRAIQQFERLPASRRIATLSPSYVCADAVRDSSLEPAFLLYEDPRGFWMHSFHLSILPGDERFDLQSPYGYGGPVSNCDDPAFRAAAWKAYLDVCRSHGIVVEFVRLHPLAPWQEYLGTVVADRQTVAIDLSSLDWRSKYQVRCRTAIRKALKSGMSVIRCTTKEVLTCFADFYRKGMMRIGAESFYLLSDDYFSALAQLSGVWLLVCVHDDGEWLSAGIFLAGGDSLEYHLSATTDRGRKLSASNLLIDAAAELAADRGLSTIYLGGGTDDSPDNALLRFKVSFSPNRLTYHYGYVVHDTHYYAILRERAGYNGNRVLFYR